MSKVFLTVCLLAIATTSIYSNNFVDTALCVLNSVSQIIDKDNGKLWKHKLSKKIIMLNTTNDSLIATSNIKNIALKKHKNYFIGKKANVDINVNDFTIINYNVGENYDVLVEKTLHDLFHTLQKKINLYGSNYAANHLTNDSSRIFMRLEWEYLWKAYNEKNIIIKNCLIDTAASCRNYRRAKYVGVDTIENRFEIVEGTAQFTGIFLSSLIHNNNKDSIILNKIEIFKNWIEKTQDYSKNYGYLSGLLYCSLLSQYSSTWTLNINKNTDLCRLLLQYTNGNIFYINAKEFSSNVKYATLIQEEKEIFEKRNSNKNVIKEKFKNSSLLILPLKNSKCNFNPSSFLYIDSLGNYCPHFTVFSNWGNLTVKQNGGIFSPDNANLFIPVLQITINEQNIIDSDNWELTLSKDYFLIKEDNNYIIKEK
ncbi:MAG: hypothetical protein LBS50_05505 [Prevotellaceae bacterium]|jgi:hypothetical protein|nr:hypothetical protein [Prevotellaceae bacterium]